MPEQLIEIKGLDELINRFIDLGNDMFSRNLMAEIGTYLIAQIQLRTSEGTDAAGMPFKPYSPKYALFREETGHSAGTVNLFYTGSMMSAMTFEADVDQVRVFFMNTKDKSDASNPLKAFALNQERQFFAMSVEEQEAILELIEEYISNILEGED